MLDALGVRVGSVLGGGYPGAVGVTLLVAAGYPLATVLAAVGGGYPLSGPLWLLVVGGGGSVAVAVASTSARWQAVTNTSDSVARQANQASVWPLVNLSPLAKPNQVPRKSSQRAAAFSGDDHIIFYTHPTPFR